MSEKIGEEAKPAYDWEVFSFPLVGEEKKTRRSLALVRPEVTPWRSAPVSKISFMFPSSSVSISVSPEADMLKGAETPEVDEVDAETEAYSPEDILKEGRERRTFYKSQQHQITNVGMKGLTAEAKA